MRFAVSARTGAYVEVISTDTPWVYGFEDGCAIGLSLGRRRSMRGLMVRHWRDGLPDGASVVRRLQEKFADKPWAEPDRPPWVTVEIDLGGSLHDCTVVAGTAFDPHGPHPENAGRAVAAILKAARAQKVRSLTLPLFGAGAGGLDPARVARRQLEAFLEYREREPDEELTVTFLATPVEWSAVIASMEAGARDSDEAEAWYAEIRRQGQFNEIRILERLLGGYSAARLDICEVVDQANAPMPLSVFKIGPPTDIRQEVENAQAARGLIGDYAVEVQGHYDLGDVAALRMPLASGGLPGEAAKSLVAFFEESGDPAEIAGGLAALFGEGLREAYAPISPRFMSIRGIRSYMEGVRQKPVWQEAAMGFERLMARPDIGAVRVDTDGEARILLNSTVGAVVGDPFAPNAALANHWDLLCETPMASHVHGDLNPRNVILVQSETRRFVPRVVDFHRFNAQGPHPLAVDFARLEAGIHVKCLRKELDTHAETAARALRKYEAFINGDFECDLSTSLVGVIAPAYTRAVFAVSAIRREFAALAGPATPDRRSYWICLAFSLLNYLRPVYDSRLSVGQRVFAVYMAITVLDRHVFR